MSATGENLTRLTPEQLQKMAYGRVGRHRPSTSGTRVIPPDQQARAWLFPSDTPWYVKGVAQVPASAEPVPGPDRDPEVDGFPAPPPPADPPARPVGTFQRILRNLSGRFRP